MSAVSDSWVLNMLRLTPRGLHIQPSTAPHHRCNRLLPRRPAGSGISGCRLRIEAVGLNPKVLVPVAAGDVHLNVPADTGSPVPAVASRRRTRGPQPVALVGFREWIFSENSGADQG